MIALLRQLGSEATDLLFPPRCLTCDALAEPFCAECGAKIRPPDPGVPLPAGLADACSAGYHEDPLRRAVVRLKFGRKVALAEPLGALLVAELETARAVWRPDALVPVPIHWTRRLERGFNQSELLAEVAARRCGLPLLPALCRTRRTAHQVGLPASVRATNPRGAFAVPASVSVAGLRLVLVDDVRTTGATLSECARVLRAAGAEEVYALTVTYDA